ncbi:MAG: DUF2019 domain-containing protein [Ignavibacteriae bacterium HGW-Ignavibacteriae-4]|jgi:hypothetical protein|nr:MAG: DUF2019 domain-containing protein [Ignavibacteriae bacterium HGW-Ignavibacteriae-4]
MKPLNNISSALNLFIESAKEHTLATEEGNYRKGNKNYYLIVEAISYLRNNNSLTELKPLLNNSYIGVRLWTACYLLPVFEKESLLILKDIVEEGGIHSLSAEMTICEWKKGNLKF